MNANDKEKRGWKGRPKTGLGSSNNSNNDMLLKPKIGGDNNGGMLLRRRTDGSAQTISYIFFPMSFFLYTYLEEGVVGKEATFKT